MLRGSIILSVLFLFFAMFPGCADNNGPIQVNPESQAPKFLGGGAVLSITDTTLNGFSVHYAGRVFNGSTTTFSYTVTGPGVDMHFRVGYPTTSCSSAPISWLPTNGATSSNDCCINPGLEWHPSVGPDPINTFDFSYSFSGNIPEGIIATSIKSNSDVEVGSISGPGVPTFLVSGTVFQDADADQVLDIDETFIADVTIRILQSNVVLATDTSDGSGQYQFAVPCGTYTVQVDTSTLTGTRSTYFVNTTAISKNVTVGPDSPGNNFGFDVNTTKVLADLGNGTLPTTGLTSGAWKKEYQFAVAGKTSFYTRTQLLAFLQTVEGLALAIPFDLPDDENGRLQFAYDILRKPAHTDFDKFQQQLLAVELNYAAGLGIDLSTQLVLIGWGESLYNDTSGQNPKGSIIQAGSTFSTATDVYLGINTDKSPGGGGTR